MMIFDLFNFNKFVMELKIFLSCHSFFISTLSIYSFSVLEVASASAQFDYNLVGSSTWLVIACCFSLFHTLWSIYVFSTAICSNPQLSSSFWSLVIFYGVVVCCKRFMYFSPLYALLLCSRLVFDAILRSCCLLFTTCVFSPLYVLLLCSKLFFEANVWFLYTIVVFVLMMCLGSWVSLRSEGCYTYSVLFCFFSSTMWSFELP